MRWALYALTSILAVYTVYFALFAVFAQVITVAVLHRRRLRIVVIVGALGLATLVSLVPWIIAARAQLTHSTGAFWVPSLSVTSLFGGLEQFFTGPPLNTWVTGFALLRALELAGDVAGCLALAALVVNRKRLTAAGAETAAFLGLAVVVGVGVMLLASFYHPLEDGKYLSAAWAPLYALLGAGLATMPWRRVAFGAGASDRRGRCCNGAGHHQPRDADGTRSDRGSRRRAGTWWPHTRASTCSSAITAIAQSSTTHTLPGGERPVVLGHCGVSARAPCCMRCRGRGRASCLVRVRAGRSDAEHRRIHIESTRCWTGVCVTMLSPSAGASCRVDRGDVRRTS